MIDKNLEENQTFNDDSIVIIPSLEQNIPIPANAAEALPSLTTEQELEMMTNTIKLLSDITGEEIKPDENQETIVTNEPQVFEVSSEEEIIDIPITDDDLENQKQIILFTRKQKISTYLVRKENNSAEKIKLIEGLND